MPAATELRYQTKTGLNAYDSIRWSAEPMSLALQTNGLKIRAVRHLGNRGKGTIRAGTVSDVDKWDALLVNRGGSGRLEVRLGGKLQSGRIRRGQISILPSDTDAVFEFPTSNEGFTLLAPAGMLASRAGLDPSVEMPPRIAQRDARIEQLLGMIEQELLAGGFGADLLIDGMISAIALAAHQIDPEAVSSEAERIYLSPGRLDRVVGFVDAHLAQPIRLDDLAAVAELSPYHFSRVFKLATGETPYNFVLARRLDRARALLAGGVVPLATIALACGFSSQSHFTSAFTREMGLAPGRYRRMIGASNG